MDPLEALRRVSRLIDEVHKAFGAPGDYGYGTPQGEALYRLYEYQHGIQQIVPEAFEPKPTNTRSDNPEAA